MNQKLTLQQIAQALAQATGSSENLAESFIKEFFALVSETLQKGESVTIKNFGKFSRTDASQELVEFIPDKEISEAINAPFSFFEPVELGDEVSDETLNEPIEIASSDEPQGEETEESAEEDEEPIKEPQEKPQSEASDEIEGEIETAEEPQEPLEEEELPEEEPEVQDHNEEEEEEYEPARKRSKGWLLFLIGLIIGAILGYIAAYFYPYDSWKFCSAKTGSAAVKAEESGQGIEAIEIPSDTAAIAQNLAAEEPVETYDTITTRRFLSTMAREYYGHPDFWVYIYLENEQMLGDPNMIAPGTVLKIPKAEKYGLDKNDPQCLRRAKIKAMEILDRYE